MMVQYYQVSVGRTLYQTFPCDRPRTFSSVLQLSFLKEVTFLFSSNFPRLFLHSVRLFLHSVGRWTRLNAMVSMVALRKYCHSP